MTHPDVEEIARFAEGNVDKSEYEKFIKHIAQCEKCRKVYSTTLKFVERERAKKKVLRLPSFPKIEIPRTLQSFGNLLAKKKLATAIVSVVVIGIMVSFLFNLFSNRTIHGKLLVYIKKNNKEIEYIESKGFDAIYPLKISAARAGFFVEDILIIIEGSDKGELVNTLHLLNCELKNIFKEKNDQFSLDTEDIGKEDLEKVVKAIARLENKSLLEIFQFGRFVEKTIFNSFKKERANQQEVEKYLEIAERNSLHQDIIKKLKKISSIKDLNVYREAWIAIRNAFKYIDYMKTKSDDHPLAERARAVFERVKNAADKKEARQAQLFVINAWLKLYAIALRDGRIAINPETLSICYSSVDTDKGDCRLAFILGHELAHLANKDFLHREAFLTWEQYGIIPSKFLENARQQRQKELNADRLGALYASMAGYDIRELFEEQDNFLNYWENQIGKENIHREPQAYPSLEERVAAIRSQLKKVADKVELFRTGVLLLQMGNFEDAKAAFLEFERHYPAREVYNNIGACFLNTARYILTKEFRKEYLRFRVSTAIDYSTSAEPDRGEGNDRMKEEIRKQLEKAISYFKEAASRDKIDKSCRYNLSASLILMGNYAEALEVCDSILDADPQDVNSMNNKAIALYYNNEKDPETTRKAIDLLEEAYRLEQKNFEVLYNLGSLKKTGARAYWEKYLELPNIPRDDFYDHVYRGLKGTVPSPLKTIDAPALPAGNIIGMDFTALEEKWGKKNTKRFDLNEFLTISVLVKDNTRIVALNREIVIVEKQISKAEKIEKSLERFGPPQQVVRHNSGNFYVYEDQGFSIKEVNDNARSYIWFEKKSPE
ncbi:MAG: tetratricopeptide repeat protein [Candidatus Aminicenantes bacterium]|jgi:tetratricopeptide (TPR) repeat protein